jgi:hypothetical protein
MIACLIAAAGAFYLLLRRRPARVEGRAEISGPDEHDRRASERLVGLIDLLFALVLTLPILVTEDVIRQPWDANLPVLLALGTAYYVVIRSFVDWHLAMEDAPYWIRTSPKKSWELKRIYVDFAIVMAYVMLFLSTKELSKHASADIGQFLFLLGVIIALYLAWGALRWVAYRAQHEYRWHTLAEALVGFLAIWGAYRLDHDRVGWFDAHAVARNTAALVLALMMLVAYRYRNWNEMRHIRALSRPAPRQD